jgi:hypothetical protein
MERDIEMILKGDDDNSTRAVSESLNEIFTHKRRNFFFTLRAF